ncbi:hypothetical protein ACQ4LE_001720 [Meloidogyne hapla]|uniref:ZP domain-containing protein n=1 Tax=Meloidogyne hapla TaxID=6305 RepID=A0A1I8B590_MELHA
MAIFYQLTSILLIISMAFIAINEGMEKGGSSGSCTVINGKFVHLGDAKNNQTKPNDTTKTNYLTVSGGKPVEVKLQFDGQRPCIAKNNNTRVDCNLKGNFLKGTLSFKITQDKTVQVPFDTAPMFSGNECVINIGTYDKEKRELAIKINNVPLKIVTAKDSKVVPCRANTA